jgi:nucleotide-binding universal stress UspA family protein
MTPGTILLATDLSCRCDRALDRATMLAAEWHARLVVLHVLEEPAPVTELPSWRRPMDPRQAARRRVHDDLEGAQAAQGIEIDIVVERGDPATAILEVVERLGGQLIVTGVARDETLGRLLLGTTVETLARKANVPVLVVKSRPRRPYHKVVVATDFSEGSRDALEAALALLPGAEVSLFHAFDVPFEGLGDDRMAARESAARQATAESEAFLATTPGVSASGRSLATYCEYGEPGALLEDLVQVRGVDLVVVGTEGRTGLAQVLLGSVAQRLLGRLRVDVLVVRRRRR